MRPRPIDVDVELEVIVEKKGAPSRRSDDELIPVPAQPMHADTSRPIFIPAVSRPLIIFVHCYCVVPLFFELLPRISSSIVVACVWLLRLAPRTTWSYGSI
jgi:hypothetical protein